MKKLATLFLVLVMLLTLTLTGCVSKQSATQPETAADKAADTATENAVDGSGDETQNDADDKLVIGMGMMIMAHPFAQDIYAGAMSVADANDAEILLVDGNFDVTTQMNGLDDIIATGKLDALMLWGVDSDSIVPTINECNRLGIPVISVDVLPSGGEMVAHVSSDNFEIGKNAGQYAMEQLKQKYDGEVKGTVVILNAPHISTMNDRTKGFIAAFDGYDDVEFIEKTVTDVNSDTFLSLVDDVTTAYPEGAFDIMFAPNSTAGVPAISGTEAAGRSDYFIVSVDACDEFAAALEKESNIFRGYVAQDGISIGIEAMTQCIKAARGEIGEYEKIAVPSIMVSAENYKEFNEQYSAQKELYAKYYTN